MFKWVCLAVGTVLFCTFAGALLWMVNDLRRDAKPVLVDLKRDMPEIVANTKKSTTALADVSDDIKAVRAVMGLTSAKDKKLMTYTSDVLELIEKEGAGSLILADNGKTTVTGKIAAHLVNESPMTVEAWVAATRTKALLVTMFGSSTREEILDKLCHNKFGTPYLIQTGKDAPIPLKQWVRSHHPASLGDG